MSSIAEQFVRARLAARPLRTYPGVVPGDLQAAYAVQEEAIGLLPNQLSEWQVAGWKVARIGPNWPPAWGEVPPEPRLNGPVFGRNVHIAMGNHLPACPVFDGGFAAVETEIVIRVGKDAPPEKIVWSVDEALDYIGYVHIGIEVASSPFAGLNELGAGAVISDFGNNWGVVVGKAIPDWRDIKTIDCGAFIDDVHVGERTVDMRSGPLDAFAFTLGKCAARGRPLRAGMWITTGMITGVHDIRIGQRSRHTFAQYGDVGCRAVCAEPID